MANFGEERYFSALEFLNYVYSQDLPLKLKAKKKNYLSALNVYLTKYLGSFSHNQQKILFDSSTKACHYAFPSTDSSLETGKKSSLKKKQKVPTKKLPILHEALLRFPNYDHFLTENDGIYVSLMKEIYSDKMNAENCKKLFKKSSNEEFASLKRFVGWEQIYSSLKSFDIAICATMSAGKSTLVNALLGCDILPSMNEATTAKITSVYDKDGLGQVVGYRQTKSGKEFSCNLDGKALKEWNFSSETKRIYLRGDLDGIKNTSKYAVAVHDTPGANNSQDQTHHNMTIEFLEKEKLDALIYVVNYEQLLTTDEYCLLKEIHEIIKDRGIPVLFVVNKVDSYDKSKENFEDAVNSLKATVRDMGYNNFSIIPVAARPARLFKMALGGKSGDFTEGECDVFDILINKFTKRMDINSMATSPVAKNAADVYGKNQGDCVIVDEKKYSVVTLREALVNTGLLGIEAAIENMLR